MSKVSIKILFLLALINLNVTLAADFENSANERQNSPRVDKVEPPN